VAVEKGKGKLVRGRAADGGLREESSGEGDKGVLMRDDRDG
jgi:hypothetical protein